MLERLMPSKTGLLSVSGVGKVMAKNLLNLTFFKGAIKEWH